MSKPKMVQVKLTRMLEHRRVRYAAGETVPLPESAAEFVVSNGGGNYVATRKPKEKDHD
jgi:hypothetical protein